MNLNRWPILIAEHQGSYWFAPAGSTFAEETDRFFMILLYIATFFFVLVVGAMVIFAIKYRRRPGYEGDSSALHNTLLEIVWTVIPTLIVCWIFIRGVNGYMDMMTPPPETIDINVTASKWNWAFTYPNGAESNELHVPINKAVRLQMRSLDVLHSFYVPAFRTKQDVVPGRVNTVWFEPILEGKYRLFCTEYCGDNHSEMLANVQVHSYDNYLKKLEELNINPEPPVAHGLWLYERKGCKGCHSLEPDKVVVGPSFANRWGQEFTDTSGQSVKVDESYFVESLEVPQAKMRPEFAKASQMPSYKGRLTPKEIDALMAMLKALQDGNITDEERDAMPVSAEAEAGKPAEANSTSDAANEPIDLGPEPTGETQATDSINSPNNSEISQESAKSTNSDSTSPGVETGDKVEVNSSAASDPPDN